MLYVISWITYCYAHIVLHYTASSNDSTIVWTQHLSWTGVAKGFISHGHSGDNVLRIQQLAVLSVAYVIVDSLLASHFYVLHAGYA